LQLQQGDVVPATDGFERALELTRRLGDLSREARELNSLGVALRASGDIAGAQRLIERSAELAKTIGDRKRHSTAVSNLATVLVDAQKWPEALQASREAVALSATLEDTWGLVGDEFNLTMPLLHVEGADSAYAHLAELTPRALSLEDAELTIEMVEMFALVVIELGHAQLTARLLAAADRHRGEVKIPRTVPDQALLDRSVEPARSSPEWKPAYEEGRTLDLPAAIAQALSVGTSTRMVSDRTE
jgi:tetratricopeptide (TPR) repeat protein